MSEVCKMITDRQLLYLVRDVFDFGQEYYKARIERDEQKCTKIHKHVQFRLNQNIERVNK